MLGDVTWVRACVPNPPAVACARWASGAPASLCVHAHSAHATSSIWEIARPVDALASVHSDVSLVHALLRTLPVLFVRLLTPPWTPSPVYTVM